MKHLILGAGNMVKALLPSYIKESGHEFSIYTPSKESARKFASEFKINFLEELSELDSYDSIWLGMKPQSVGEVSKEIKGKTKRGCYIFSILAGTSSDELIELFDSQKVVRIMPNTPSSVGEGVNLIYRTEEVGDIFFNSFLKEFSLSAKNYTFSDESKIDMLTPFSGSGPAYFFEICRLYVEKMKEFDIPEKIATEMMALTMKGASQMIIESSESLETLRENVTSKKGVTYEALKVLNEENIEQVLSKSIDKAYNRVLELQRGE